MTRALSAMLIIVLFVTSTPAAPQVLTSLSPGWHSLSRDLVFYTSQWWSSLKAQLERKPEQEKQAERDERAVKIEIAPGDVTIETGQEITFAATAYANDGLPVGGVSFKWLAEESGKGKSVGISRTGVFVSKVAGDFRISVEGAGRRAQVNVKVLGNAVNDNERRAERPFSEKEVSTRDFLEPQSSSLKQQEKDERKTSSLRKKSGSEVSLNHAPSPAPVPIPIEGEWNDTNYRSADDPLNRRGDPPDQVSGDSPGSGNFQASAPVLELPGRGIELQLRLTYNSALWNESGTEITYDIDHDWPAPGWSLGFGRLITMGSSGSMLVDADGTRHGFNGTMSNYSFGSTFTGHTTDSTFIDYTHTANASGVITSATARHSDGTIVAYGAPA
ncbi:MAG: hypothetical protein JOZ52_00890, partial [Acidobacteria bacterium]|nr:hypothetical protein [Acidobacteriota bacterium]